MSSILRFFQQQEMYFVITCATEVMENFLFISLIKLVYVSALSESKDIIRVYLMCFVSFDRVVKTVSTGVSKH